MAAVDPTVEALQERYDREESELARLEADHKDAQALADELREQVAEKRKRLTTLSNAITELGGSVDDEPDEPGGSEPDEPEPAGPSWLLDGDELVEKHAPDEPEPEAVKDEPEPEPAKGFTGRSHAEVAATFRDFIVAHKGLTYTPAELAQELDMHTTTVKQLIKEFLRTGLLEEDRKRKSRNDKRNGGRLPMAYKYREDKGGPKTRAEVAGTPTRSSARGPSGPVAFTGKKPKITDADTRRLIEAATMEGWTISGAGAHLKLRSPEGRTVIVSRTPSDHRSVLNARAQLRRAGLSV